ncbi:MAG: AAA family ATPase [Solirubrobacteraceae bacterium]
MHLKSLTMKGFKSFPDRTRLEFGPGVSVIVGPNGSGKSNVTDAVLWALGEQSPLAVRGASMQDVIFGGGRGVQARTAAEVELVLDNGSGSELYPMSEISIQRRLDRAGDGEYRLNGARCRLVDVLEVLSDTGLGKEMHSVVSQGRIEAIVTSKPRDRRLLIEEAAGLGKHRKRRRRAQLKLERTQDNLDRALDVEREARSRLRPLKRQAEAAELHERLERQSLEARWELARDAVRAQRAGRAEAEAAAAAARTARAEAEQRLAEVAVRRERAEEALARRTEVREALAGRVYAARAARDRVDSRLERAAETASTLSERVERRAVQIAALEAEAAADAPDEAGRERIGQLEAELERLDREREAELERELAALEAERAAAEERAETLSEVVAQRRSALAAADAAAEAARRERREAEKTVEAARRGAAKVGAELAAANQFLRSHAGAPGGARPLAGELEVDEGYELALAAALDGRLGAAVVEDLPAGSALLDRAGRDGGRALVLRADGAASSAGPASADLAARPADAASSAGPASAGPSASAAAPTPDAVPLISLVRGPDAARALLAGVWVVEDLAALPADFAGVAVTGTGRAWSAPTRELRQVAEGGAERVLAERNRRDRLIAESERAIQAERAALAAAEAAGTAVSAADAARDEADQAARQADRDRSAAGEELRRTGWLIEQRRQAPQEGAAAVRRAQIEGELAAERRTAERAARERAERGRRLEYLRAQKAAGERLQPLARTLAETLGRVSAAVANRVEALEAELAADREAGEGVAAQLRACAREEAEIQAQLRERGDALTTAEVRAQQLRDAEAEASLELNELAERLAFDAEPATEPLEPQQADALRARIERLAKRREQLGPVNPLAKDEYAQAVAHVEELEAQREDLETALRELRQLIRDTDREIRETFEATFAAAAQNFEELAQHVFPGGRGKLRLVREDAGPRPVLGGQEPEASAPSTEEAAEAAAEAEDNPTPEEDLLGVEIEITPAGKSTKRLTLLSGGEKSMTAIAFLFAVFLAKPCPFYILDEVEAALDDLNLERFLALLERYADRAQFIVVTHQKKTMDAADCLYGVSMGGDGVSKVVSRRLPARAPAEAA